MVIVSFAKGQRANLEVVAHDHPIQVLGLQGFDPLAQMGAAADGGLLDQPKKRRDSQSAVSKAIRFADRTRQAEVILVGTHATIIVFIFLLGNIKNNGLLGFFSIDVFSSRGG
jgi:hypothetical protein